MFESLFTFLYEAMMGTFWIAVMASFVWGILSIILSPCHLSSIPLVVGYISSQGKISVGRTFNISLIFSLGILITIAAIGIITASLGRLMGDVGSVGNYLVAGILHGSGVGSSIPDRTNRISVGYYPACSFRNRALLGNSGSRYTNR